jgi:serine/threonine-protein kinase
VLLSFDGEVKLCDFGIARANPLAAPAASEAIQGKAGYMSPEQAKGAAVDARSDVFAAGIILWELLSGRRLYKAKAGEKLLAAAVRADVPAIAPRGLPLEDELHAIVMRALERDPEARFQSADAMLRALEDYAMRAQLVASPLRFGSWLSEHFGAEIIDPRRAGERAMRALALGPPAVLEPIEPVTPSTFTVTARAPEELPTLDADTSREDPTVVPPRVATSRSEIAEVVPLPSMRRYVVFWAVAAAAFLTLIGSAVHAFGGY